jgi:hypothetical protein
VHRTGDDIPRRAFLVAPHVEDGGWFGPGQGGGEVGVRGAGKAAQRLLPGPVVGLAGGHGGRPVDADADQLVGLLVRSGGRADGFPFLPMPDLLELAVGGDAS